MKITWLGQAGLLFEKNGYKIMVDPYFSDSVGKLQPSKSRRFPVDESFFEIKPNMMIFTHNHMDHYDPETAPRFITADSNITVLSPTSVYNEAKQLGGLGICGRPLCCSSFLEDFQQVSIKMAKEQNLSLNPTKISGTCGRLMCCLRYENDVYVEAGKKCPRADNVVMTPKGKGIVIESNILCGKCKVKLDSDPENIIPFDAEDLKVIPKQKKPQTPSNEKANGQNSKENQ